MTKTLLSTVVLVSALFVPTFASASVIQVSDFGVGGWKSDDTRNSAGANLVGINNTHAGKPGQAATAADDAAIAAQIQFVAGPAGSTYGGAVSIDGTPLSAGKSNFSVINQTTGFDAAANLLTTFSATYEWYKQNVSGGSTLAFKLGIQSTDWGTGAGESQNAFTAQRSGESVWDLVLVHVPTTVSGVWSTVTVDDDSGAWSLFRQATNGFFTGAIGAAQTLDAWALDPYYGSRLFGTDALVTSIQFGLGSSQPNGFGYVDYLQTNLLNGGDVVDFGPVAVPEPGTLALFGFGLAGLGLVARRRKIAG